MFQQRHFGSTESSPRVWKYPRVEQRRSVHASVCQQWETAIGHLQKQFGETGKHQGLARRVFASRGRTELVQRGSVSL